MNRKQFITQSRFHSDEHVSEWVSHSWHTTLEEGKRHVAFMASDHYPYVDYRIIDVKGREYEIA